MKSNARFLNCILAIISIMIFFIIKIDIFYVALIMSPIVGYTLISSFRRLFIVKLRITDINIIMIILQYLIVFRHDTLPGSGKKIILEAIIFIWIFFSSLYILLRYIKIKININKLYFLYLIFIFIGGFIINFNLNVIYYMFRLIAIVFAITAALKVNKYNKRSSQFILNLTYYLLIILQSSIWLIAIINQKLSFNITLTGVYRFGGIIVHPTTMGTISCIIIILTIAKMKENKEKYLNLCIIYSSILSAILTNSRITLVILLLVLFMGVIYISNGLKKYLVLVFLLISMIFIGVYINNNSEWFLNFITRNAGLSNLTDLSGRRDLWNLTDDLVREKPILGYGFGSSSMLIDNYYMGTNESAGSFENAYITCIIENGIIGITLLGLSIIYLTINIYKIKNKNVRFQYIMIVISILLEGVSQPSFAGTSRIQFYIFSLCMISTLNEGLLSTDY